jgi:hypothetical protein
MQRAACVRACSGQSAVVGGLIRGSIAHHRGINVSHQVVRDRSIGANLLPANTKRAHKHEIGMHPIALRLRTGMPTVGYRERAGEREDRQS